MTSAQGRDQLIFSLKISWMAIARFPHLVAALLQPYRQFPYSNLCYLIKEKNTFAQCFSQECSGIVISAA